MHCKQFVSLSVASLMLAAVLTGERPLPLLPLLPARKPLLP